MLKVVKSVDSKEIGVSKITEEYWENLKWGIWFRYKKNTSSVQYLCKLSQSFDGGSHYFLVKYSGQHGGWGSGRNLNEFVQKFIDRNEFDIWIPETKQEMIELINQYT